MQINWLKAESRNKPTEIDKTTSDYGVYIRQNISEETRLDNDDNEYTVYCYNEAFLSFADYEQYTNANYIVNAIELKHESEIIDNYTLQLLEGGIL
jgi:hypothetical protein